MDKMNHKTSHRNWIGDMINARGARVILEIWMVRYWHVESFLDIVESVAFADWKGKESRSMYAVYCRWSPAEILALEHSLGSEGESYKWWSGRLFVFGTFMDYSGKLHQFSGEGKYRCLRNMYFNKSLPYQYRKETICGLNFFTGFYFCFLSSIQR